jgi:hypothetical protein
MTRDVQEPVLERDARRHDETVERHPAYGQIGASRVSSGTGAVLYGSDFRHGHFVMIELHESELHRTLNRDWPFARRTIARVSLSEAQWARFVSALNTGDMAQCTIEFTDDGEGFRPALPAPPQRTEQFKDELARDLQHAVTLLADLRRAVGELKLPAKSQERLQALAHRAAMAITDGAPHVAKSFSEHVEQNVERAKVEINAHVTATIQRAGLEALQRPFELPEEGEK